MTLLKQVNTCPYRGVGSLQCLLGNLKKSELDNAIELDINAIVSLKSTDPHGKSNANTLQSNKTFDDIVIAVVLKAMGMNFFLLSPVDHSGLIYAFLVHLLKSIPLRYNAC